MNTEAKKVEIELLLACARGQLNDADTTRVTELLRQKLDWPYLLAQAKRHWLTPRFQHQLSRCSDAAIPPAVAEQLQNAARINSARSLVLTMELLELLDAFSAAGLRAIPFKGPTLALQAYGDLALRQFCDLDLLIKEAEFAQARALLVARGYRPHDAMTLAQEAQCLRLIGHLAMDGRDGTIMVELHTAVTSLRFCFALDYDHLWERLVPLDVLGRKVSVLAPEDTLVILCVHGTKHHWERLGWVCDVAELIRSQANLDWPRVLRHARQTDSLRMLCLGLHLAQQLLAAPLPPEVLAVIAQEPHVRQLAEELRARLFSDEPHTFGFWEDCRFFGRVRRRPWDGLWYCFSMILIPQLADWRAVPLPACLAWTY
ncbi:MAG: nucleotidyltransferase family protein [Kiritimatiellaeota bacterium]|nr:nucleotidyltransferase family protein [Kiritimatiellota bacterium]